MEIVVFSEKLDRALELLAGARALAKDLDATVSVVLLGNGGPDAAHECLRHGAQVVRLGRSPLLDPARADLFAAALASLVGGRADVLVLVASTRLGKEVAPRLAQRLGAGCVTDALGIRLEAGSLLVDRYALGGNTVATERIKTPRKVVAVAPGVFRPEPVSSPSSRVEEVDLDLAPSPVAVVERTGKTKGGADIQSAEVLVCVGRGLARQEDLAMVQELAAALGAEVGCTRPLAADYRWLSEDRMVGISANRCRPRLMISLGVSGQIQHSVGIMDSKVIVAINKDKEAPIFKLADYGIVGDLYQVVPSLTQRLRALRESGG